MDSLPYELLERIVYCLNIVDIVRLTGVSWFFRKSIGYESLKRIGVDNIDIEFSSFRDCGYCTN